MFKRQTTGSVVCASCRSLVGVNDDTCYNCGRRNPGLWGFGPMLRAFGNDLGFVSLVVYGCSALYIISLALTVAFGGNIMGSGNPFTIMSPHSQILELLGSSGAVPAVIYNRWWTIFSASWLHAGVLHVLFNMLWVRQLGPVTADIYGPGRMIIIYTLAGAVGFTLSSLAGYYTLRMGMPIPFLRGAAYTVGASAAIFGLLGALVHYGRRAGSSIVRTEAMGYALTLGIMGFIMPGVDNYAHAGGFLGGYVASVWLDPLKPERMDHLVGAALCMLVAGLAIVSSVLTGLPAFLGH
jgi:rhomboid protease GluP